MNSKVLEARRALFEAQCIDCGLPFIGRCTEPGYTHQYENPLYEARWRGFNAALDSVEIELPDATDVLCGDTVDSCRAAIESTNLGLRVK